MTKTHGLFVLLLAFTAVWLYSGWVVIDLADANQPTGLLGTIYSVCIFVGPVAWLAFFIWLARRPKTTTT